MVSSRALLQFAVAFACGVGLSLLARSRGPSSLLRLPRAYTNWVIAAPLLPREVATAPVDASRERARSLAPAVKPPGQQLRAAAGKAVAPVEDVLAEAGEEAAAAAPEEEALPLSRAELAEALAASLNAKVAAETPSTKAVKRKKARRIVRGDTYEGPVTKAETLPSGKHIVVPAGPRPALPKIWAEDEDIPDFCTEVERWPEEPVEWRVLEEEDIDGEAHPCFLANVSHWALKYYHKLDEIKMCTHDPKVDTVISDHLHKWSFWGSPDEWMVLLAAGPCTPERPYMLDIGANLGIFTLVGAERGCHAIAFEPLSENVHRLWHSAKVNGYLDRVMLLQHAVGKQFTEVTIGFRPSNPGASSIGGTAGLKTETVQQITIDGLLLGKNPPAFKDAAAKNLPPIAGQYIGFVKVDTEGYDVAVVAGMMRTFVEGRVPLMLIEFGPGDAQGTAGCDPYVFVDVLYEAGYALWEWGYEIPLPFLKDPNIAAAINGTGRRVFESWFISPDLAPLISRKQPDGRMKLKAEGF